MKNLKTLTSFLVAILLMSWPVTVFPCGPGEPDPFMFFSPKRISSVVFHGHSNAGSDFYPFSQLDEDSADKYCSIELPDRKDRNITDWKAYLSNLKPSIRADESEVANLIYKMKLTDLKKAMSAGKSGDRLLDQFISNKNKSILDYLVFAKEIEPVVTWNPNYWYSDTEEPTFEQYEKYRKEALAKANKEQDRSIRIRYLFQAMRLAHYHHSYSSAISIYTNKLKDLKKDDPLYYRILGIYAGALIKTDQTAKALPIFAEIFQNDPYTLQNIIVDFRRHASSKSLQTAWNNTKDPDLKTTLALIYSLATFDPAIDQMQNVLKEGEIDERLNYMLLKEIQKLETRSIDEVFFKLSEEKKKVSQVDESERFSISGLWNAIVEFFTSSLIAAPTGPLNGLPKSEIDYIRKLQSFTEAASKNKKIKNPELWHLANAYLYFLLGNISESQQLLNHPSIKSSVHPFIKSQSAQIKMLLAVAHNDRLTDHVKRTVSSHYSVFEDSSDKVNSGGYFDRGARHFIRDRMVLLHKRAGQKGVALLYENDLSDVYDESSTFLYSIDSIEKAIQTIEKPRNDYDRFLRQVNSKGTLDLLYDRLGGRALAAGLPEKALDAFRKLPESHLKSMVREYTDDAGPFQNHFYETFPKGKDANDWNKKNIAEKLVELSKTKSAESYYRQGLLYFNTSHYGNWWIVTKPYRSMYYRFSEKPQDPQMELAKSYFKKAIESGANDDTSAASHYMIAMISYLSGNQEGNYNKKHGITEEQKEQFNILEDRYHDTKFFIRVVDSCSYYKLASR